MKAYQYNRLTYAGLSGKTGVVVMLLTVAVLIVFGLATGGSVGLALLVAVVYGLLLYGFSCWPNLTCDDEALFVEFLGWPIKIPWAEVLGVKEIYSLPKRAWLVTARKITFLHYFFGLQFSLKWAPGFLIWENISNREELLSKIRRRTKATK